MILILGGSGYVGGAFAKYFQVNSIEHKVISRRDVDYYNVAAIEQMIEDSGCEFLINAAGYTGKPNVDACELHKTDCLLGNATLPGLVRKACENTNIAWGHVSSGCIYTGNTPNGKGFAETDAANFSFRQNNCSFYSGCKALGEECLEAAEKIYIWRLRIPFNNIDGPRNYITKLMRYERLLEAENSITNLDDFARVCCQCWERRVPFGTYNVTNTGSITSRRMVEMIQNCLQPNQEFDFFESESEFMRLAAKTPRSNCVMNNSKLLATGIEIDDVETSVSKALKNWQTSETNSKEGVK